MLSADNNKKAKASIIKKITWMSEQGDISFMQDETWGVVIRSAFAALLSKVEAVKADG